MNGKTAIQVLGTVAVASAALIISTPGAQAAPSLQNVSSTFATALTSTHHLPAPGYGPAVTHKNPKRP